MSHDNNHDANDGSDESSPPEGSAGERGRRAHLAVVDPKAGKAGTPTPSERQQVYLAQLRRGDIPHGWVTARAKEWGISHATVSQEIDTAREILDASRTPDEAAWFAHELIEQSVELADTMQRLASAPLAAKGDAPDVTAAKAQALEARVRALASVASIKLKAAGEIRALYGLGGRPSSGRRRRSMMFSDPHPLTRDAVLGRSLASQLREDAPVDIGAGIKAGLQEAQQAKGKGGEK